MQGRFNICKPINVMKYTHEIKDKNHIFIPINADKAFDKIQHAFMIKVLERVGLKRTYLNSKGFM